jgi:hypothetical protein
MSPRVLIPALVLLLLSGCVRRIHEAPGLSPGSPLAVRADMRVETFEVAAWEVRAFRFALSGGNTRRYQFVVLKNGLPELDLMVEQSPDGSWGLVERRPDGISITHQTWTAEPAYGVAKSAVVTLLRDRGALR